MKVTHKQRRIVIAAMEQITHDAHRVISNFENKNDAEAILILREMFMPILRGFIEEAFKRKKTDPEDLVKVLFG